MSRYNDGEYQTVISITPEEARDRQKAAERVRAMETNSRIWKEQQSRMIWIDGQQYLPDSLGATILLEGKSAIKRRQKIEQAKRIEAEERKVKKLEAELKDPETQKWFRLAEIALKVGVLDITLYPKLRSSSGVNVFDEKNKTLDKGLDLSPIPIPIPMPVELVEGLQKNRRLPLMHMTIGDPPKSWNGFGDADLLPYMYSSPLREIWFQFYMEKENLQSYFDNEIDLDWCAMCRAIYALQLPDWVDTDAWESFYIGPCATLNYESSFQQNGPKISYMIMFVQRFLSYRLKEAIDAEEMTVRLEGTKKTGCALQ